MAAAAAPRDPASGSGAAEGSWGPWAGQAAPLRPVVPHMPCAYAPMPCYGWLSPPPLGRLLTQPVPPGELLPPPAPPLLLPGPLLCSALLHTGRPKEPCPRAKAAATSRESTAALKAWLGRHLKNPYPSKGEKVLLALVSHMSLTQVSTWFANARRRLKKENRACWAPRTPKAEGEGPPGESAGPRATQPRTEPPTAGPQSAPSAAQPRASPLRPKIWRVAELATSPPAERGSAA